MNKDKLASSDIEKQNSRNSRAQKTRLDSYQLYVKLRVDPTKTNKKSISQLEEVYTDFKEIYEKELINNKSCLNESGQISGTINESETDIQKGNKTLSDKKLENSKESYIEKGDSIENTLIDNKKSNSDENNTLTGNKPESSEKGNKEYSNKSKIEKSEKHKNSEEIIKIENNQEIEKMSEISKTIEEFTKKLENCDNLNFLYFMEKLKEELEKIEKVTYDVKTYNDSKVPEKIVNIFKNSDTNIKKVIDNIDEEIKAKKAQEEEDKKKSDEMLGIQGNNESSDDSQSGDTRKVIYTRKVFKLETGTPTFKKNGELSIDEWIDKVENSFRCADIPDNMKIPVALNYLKETAFNIGKRHAENSSWDKLTEELRSVFRTFDLEGKLLKSLLHLRHNDSFETYLDKFYQLTYQLKLNEEESLKYFLAGLQDRVRHQLIREGQNKKLSDAITSAASICSIEKEMPKINSLVKKTFCSFCRKTNHTYADCFKRPKGQNQNNNARVIKNYKKTDRIVHNLKPNNAQKQNSYQNYNKTKKPNTSNITCYNCDRKGHIASECKIKKQNSAIAIPIVDQIDQLYKADNQPHRTNISVKQTTSTLVFDESIFSDPVFDEILADTIVVESYDMDSL